MKFFKFRYYMRKLNVQSVCTVATAAVSIEFLSLLSLKCARLSSFRNKVKRMMIIFVRKLVITWPWRYWVSNWTGNNWTGNNLRFFPKAKKSHSVYSYCRKGAIERALGVLTYHFRGAYWLIGQLSHDILLQSLRAAWCLFRSAKFQNIRPETSCNFYENNDQKLFFILVTSWRFSL